VLLLAERQTGEAWESSPFGNWERWKEQLLHFFTPRRVNYAPRHKEECVHRATAPCHYSLNQKRRAITTNEIKDITCYGVFNLRDNYCCLTGSATAPRMFVVGRVGFEEEANRKWQQVFVE